MSTSLPSTTAAQDLREPAFTLADYRILHKCLLKCNKLTTENFNSWSVDIKTNLSCYPKIHRIVTGQCQPPDEEYNEQMDITLAPLLMLVIERNPSKQDNLMMVINRVPQPRKASDIYKAVEKAHADNCQQRVKQLELEFDNLRYRGSAMDLSKKFFTLTEKFEAFGKPLSNDELVLRIRLIFANSRVLNSILEDSLWLPEKFQTPLDWFNRAIARESIHYLH